ncbi:MAG: 16S rRNA (cytosine(967)-C(5))-methyltransferase RsmB [Gemmatimonadetes bacterium]|nr:16S rRNA (cytosine(967)-C(5))-methyltransferase RsmB [Gemmatimonadota bacterium]
MTGVTPGRRAALDVLRAVRRGQRVDRALEDAFRRLRSRDRGWTHELVYGTLRLRGRIDHLLDHHVRGGTGSLSADLLDILRLGVYQLLYMDGVPAYAAVSQSVSLAKSVAGPGAGGLTNAVLRALATRGEDRSLFPPPHLDHASHLAAWGSHPRWLVERWLARWPFAEVERLVEADNRLPDLCVLPIGIEVQEAMRRLGEAGVAGEAVGHDTQCVRLPREVRPDAVLAAVPGVILDPAAALVARYCEPPPGSTIVDLCAAPGGKALALAQRARYLVAADRSAARLRLARENRARVSGPVGFVVADAGHPPVRPVDFVVLDAPCTGTGTLRRHPDAKWRLRPEQVAEMAQVQQALLDGAAEAVAVDGILVYATCTLEPEENEEQVEEFLRRHPAFSRAEAGGVPPEFLDGLGQLVVRPQHTGFDGAFAARLRRRS